MKTNRRIHPRYKEFETAREKGVLINQMFGKFQYIYSSEKGKISLINLPGYLETGKDRWEIYCLEGCLFDDTEVFGTKREALVIIKKYLK